MGLVAFIDETVLHQLLHWHHFYDKSTLAVGPASDGLFHAGGFIAMVAGLFLLADAHRRGGFVPKRWWGGLLLGAWLAAEDPATEPEPGAACCYGLRSASWTHDPNGHQALAGFVFAASGRNAVLEKLNRWVQTPPGSCGRGRTHAGCRAEYQRT